MNAVKAVVTKVLSSPHYMLDKWWVDIEYNSHGSIRETRLMFGSRKKADSVDVGYKFNV